MELQILDSFEDYETRGYLRNTYQEKDTRLVGHLETAAFEQEIISTVRFLRRLPALRYEHLAMRIEHTIPAGLLENRRVRILVVGAGGTGSAIAMGLPYLDKAMRAWGRSQGIDAAMMDADVVSETNCVRQPFSISDIGLNKATVLINRINLF